MKRSKIPRFQSWITISAEAYVFRDFGRRLLNKFAENEFFVYSEICLSKYLIWNEILTSISLFHNFNGKNVIGSSRKTPIYWAKRSKRNTSVQFVYFSSFFCHVLYWRRLRISSIPWLWLTEIDIILVFSSLNQVQSKGLSRQTSFWIFKLWA